MPDSVGQSPQWACLVYSFLYLTISAFCVRICNKHSGGVTREIIKMNILLYEKF